MSQLSQPIPIPERDSPDEQHRQPSAGSSREGSPSSSPGSKRKREEAEERDEDSNDQDTHLNKKRKTPPIESESSHQAEETPRMGQIQKKVEEMKVNRLSGGPYQTDPINGLTNPQTDDAAGREQEPEKENDAADQPPSTPNKEDQAKPEIAEPEAQEIETDEEEASAPVDTEMAVAARRRANGLKRLVHLDRPIEIDPQEYNRKRKASEKLAGSPFSSPAAKRAKEDAQSRIKSPTITEEKSEPLLKPPSTPQAPSSSGLKGFSAFASVTSPFAAVKSSENAPFGGGTRPSTIFGGGAAPKFKSPFPTFSPFTTPKQPGTTSILASPSPDTDSSQDLTKDTSTTPFPSASATPVFGAPSTVGTSATTKSVFGRPSAFGVVASPLPSAVGPTRRAKSPRPSAFGAYASTAGRFAAPSSKIRAKSKAEENGESKESDEGTSGEEKGDEDKSKTFSEMLAAKGSDREESGDEKMVFTEQETVTGEEGEINVFHGRGKLWHRVGAEWKERGPGVFKLNVNKETGTNPRILMRREGALNLLINAKLFEGMSFAAGPDPRYVTFAILDEDLKPKSHLLRFHTAKLAQDLLERAQVHIPK